MSPPTTEGYLSHENRRALPALTGLRFLAALDVVLFHYASVTARGLPGPIVNIIHRGSAGVTLFFVLSGFILAYNYLGRDTTKVDSASFWWARFARIYPIYFVAFLLMAPFYVRSSLGPLTGPNLVHGASDAAITLVMIQAWIPAKVYVWNYPAWTLSVEAFFYLVFPYLAPRMARLSSTRLLGIAPLIAGLTMLVPLYAFVSGHTGTPGIRHLTLQPIYCLTMFAVGIAAGVLYLRHRDSDWGRMVLLPSATAVLALLTLNRVDESPFYIPCLILSFAGLVYGLAFGQGTVARLLSRGRIVLLGEASYGMYILQDPIDAVYQTVVKHMVSVPPAHVLESWPAVLLYVLLLVLCSVVSLRVIETPARLWLKAALSDWRSAKGSRPSDAAVSVPSFPG